MPAATYRITIDLERPSFAGEVKGGTTQVVEWLRDRLDSLSYECRHITIEQVHD